MGNKQSIGGLMKHNEPHRQEPKEQKSNIQSQNIHSAQSGFKGIDFAKIAELDTRLENDDDLLQSFQKAPEEVLKQEGLILPEGMQVRFDETYKKERQSAKHASASGDKMRPSSFEIRIGHIVISE